MYLGPCTSLRCVLISDESGSHHSVVGGHSAHGDAWTEADMVVRALRQQTVQNDETFHDARQSCRLQLHCCVEMLQCSCRSPALLIPATSNNVYIIRANIIIIIIIIIQESCQVCRPSKHPRVPTAGIRVSWHHSLFSLRFS